MTEWMTDAELADTEEERAKDEGQRVHELTKEIQELEAIEFPTRLDKEALEIKKRLCRACRRNQSQHKRNAAALRATKPPMKSYPPHGAAPMSKW